MTEESVIKHLDSNDLFKHLDNLGIEYVNYEHEPVFSVGDSKHLNDLIDGGHCRNLFLRTQKKDNYLIVVLDETPIDLKKLAKSLGEKRFSFGRPERLWEILGVKPGSVCPFALINDKEQKVNIVLEKAMIEHEWVNYHPLINTMSTKLRSVDLIKFIKSCGHEPLILDMGDIKPDE